MPKKPYAKMYERIFKKNNNKMYETIKTLCQDTLKDIQKENSQKVSKSNRYSLRYILLD